tara:strand:- start:91 stop:558 length:468 start_codon:yes stop_codon:yes gene_type:complete
MKFSNFFMLLTVLCMPSISSADVSSEKEAEKLLNMTGTQEMMDQSMSQMLDIQLQQNPALAPYKLVMMEFFKKHMSYESLKPELIKAYSKEFTGSELREINTFYLTNVGKKTIEKMPALMAQTAQMGATRVQENIGELQAMIQAESKRIQILQSE